MAEVVVVMVFDIGNLHVKGREWKVGKGEYGLLLKDGIRRGTGRERKGLEREKKGSEAACPNTKNCSPAPGQ